MRKINSFILCVFALLLFSSGASAHEGDHKTFVLEQLWKEKGLPVIFMQYNASYPGSEAKINRYIKSASSVVVQDLDHYRSFFRDTAFHSGNLPQIREWLDSRKEFYFKELQAYDYLLDTALVEEAVGTMGGPPPACINVDFESGDFTGWNLEEGFAYGFPDPTGLQPYTGATSGVYDPGSMGHIIEGVHNYYDPLVGGTVLPMVAPGGDFSVRLQDAFNGWRASRITTSFMVDASSPWYMYRYAVVLEDPGDHPDTDRPYFEVKLYTSSGPVSCGNYKVIAKPPIAGFEQVSPYPMFYFRNWTDVMVPLDDYIGQMVTVEFTVADCAWGGHLGYAYIDGTCLSGNLSYGPCAPDQREVTAPEGFNTYNWTGPKIIGDNYVRTITSGGGGDFSVLMVTEAGCIAERTIAVPACTPVVPASCGIGNVSAVASACSGSSNTFQLSGAVDITGISEGFLVISNSRFSEIFPVSGSGTFNYTIGNITADGQAGKAYFRIYSSRHFSEYTLLCEDSLDYVAPGACATINFECENCIQSFAPEAEKKYVVSLWVKEDALSYPPPYSYANAFVRVIFNGTPGPAFEKFYAEGEIIDDWQRIYGEFEIPAGTVSVSFQLGTDNGTANFDDIRVYPMDGTFKTYVYDPITLRLAAELDENNYATFYEYDEDGALVRVKKETEKGIQTIQENRSFKAKQ